MYNETKPIRQGMEGRTIDAGIGEIRYSTGSIPLKTMMEELEAAISRGIPILKIENVLRAL